MIKLAYQITANLQENSDEDLEDQDMICVLHFKR